MIARPRHLRPAFSLLEIVVVMAVIAIMLGMTMPAMKAISRDNDRAQAINQIQAYIIQARSVAIAQHRQAGVVFFEETAAYSNPVHAGQTAMQLIIEDYNQAAYNPTSTNTVFIEFSQQRQYLPAGIHVAALNDDLARGVTTGDESSSSVGKTRAVLFNADGHMIMRHGLARPDVGNGAPGTYPRARGDWQMATKRGNASLGVSSPGVFVFNFYDYTAAALPTDDSPASNAQRNNWVKRHAGVVLVNPNTGSVLNDRGPGQ